MVEILRAACPAPAVAVCGGGWWFARREMEEKLRIPSPLRRHADGCHMQRRDRGVNIRDMRNPGFVFKSGSPEEHSGTRAHACFLTYEPFLGPSPI